MKYNKRSSDNLSEHPFHPRKGQPSKPMRSYESIKKELSSKAITEALENAKKEYKGLKGEYSKTKQGNFMKVHPLDRE